MKIFTLIFLLSVSPVLAQKDVPPPPMPATRPHTSWGGLYSIFIPKRCDHSREMKGKDTCRVYLRFSPVVPSHRLFFRTWDESGEDDSLNRIFLANPSPNGIYVQGVLGHRIFVEVTYR